MSKIHDRNKTSQNREILAYMKKGNKITQADAVRMFGCYRLSARIHDLREEGHIIKTTERVEKNRYGHTTNFAEYELIEE